LFPSKKCGFWSKRTLGTWCSKRSRWWKAIYSLCSMSIQLILSLFIFTYVSSRLNIYHPLYIKQGLVKSSLQIKRTLEYGEESMMYIWPQIAQASRWQWILRYIYILYCEMIWNEMTKCERKHKTHDMKEKNYNKNDQIKAPFVLNSYQGLPKI
jgi:hypothetical protein